MTKAVLAILISFSLPLAVHAQEENNGSYALHCQNSDLKSGTSIKGTLELEWINGKPEGHGPITFSVTGELPTMEITTDMEIKSWISADDLSRTHFFPKQTKGRDPTIASIETLSISLVQIVPRVKRRGNVEMNLYLPGEADNYLTVRMNLSCNYTKLGP